MEVFMDDFRVYVESFDACLENLSRVLTRCIETNLVLNFEKCHFMVIEGIVLGYLVSSRGIEVDKSKIDIITSLPNPSFVREVRSFLGHDVDFKFNQPCVEAFLELKTRLTFAPILQAPNWEYSFELMLESRSRQTSTCDCICIPNNGNNLKELLAIVFALDKFRSYLLGSKIIIFSNQVAFKLDAKPRVIRWILLLQEFNIEIRHKKGGENSVADHLSRIERKSDPMPI
ncbi:Retrovirus-related Pol polyprotein, partial [Mucuna pruriens]